MVKRPDDDFIKLREALIELGQGQVVRYLEAPAVDSTDRAVELAVTTATAVDVCRDNVHGWKAKIVNHRTELVERLSVNDELISELFKFGVINDTFREILQVLMLCVTNCLSCFAYGCATT